MRVLTAQPTAAACSLRHSRHARSAALQACPRASLSSCARRSVVACQKDGESVDAEVVGDDEESSDSVETPLDRLKALAAAGGADGEELSSVVADLEAALSASADRAAAAAAEADAAVKGGKDSLLRLQAEFQNFRNRTDREKAEISDRVKGSVLEELIPLIDNFEAAKQFIKPESEGEKKIEGAYQALYKQMTELFRKMGIEAVPTVGQPFDPAIHEAIARVPTAGVTEDTVAQEYRKGFKIGARLIRPATVSVSTPEEVGAVAEEGEASADE